MWGADFYSLDTIDNDADRNFVCFAAATRIMILHYRRLPMVIPNKDHIAFNYDAKDEGATAKLIGELLRPLRQERDPFLEAPAQYLRLQRLLHSRFPAFCEES